MVRSPLLLALCCSAGILPAVAAAQHPDGVRSTQITGLSGRPFAIRISSTGVVYTTQRDANSVATFSLSDAAPGPSIVVGADPGDVVFTRNGATAFVSALHGGGVHVIDVASIRQTVEIHITGSAYRLVLSSDESTLFVSSTDGRVYVVDVARRRVAAHLQLRGAIQGLALTPSGRSILASSTNGSCGSWTRRR